MSTKKDNNEGADLLKIWCDENDYDNKFYESLKELDFEEPYDLKLLSEKDFDELCNELKLKFGKKTRLKKKIQLIKKPNNNKNDNNNNNNNNDNNIIDDEKNENIVDFLLNNNNNNNNDNESKQKEGANTSNKISLIATPEYIKYPIGQNSNEFYIMASLKAPYFKAKERAPIDLVCVVDTSGSMSGDRISLVKETLKFIVKNLSNIDRFGVIGFSDHATQICSLINMNDLGKNKAEKAIEKMRATGSTALCDGLVKGVNMLRNRKTKSKVSSVLLFTDGQANQGPTTADAILKAAKAGKIENNYNKQPYYNNNMNNNMNNNWGGGFWGQPQQQQQQQIQGYQQPQQSFIGSLFGSKSKSSKVIDNNNKDENLPVINTFGFGSGHNALLLQNISEKTDGMYAYIEGIDNIGETFAQCIGGLASMVAQDLRITLEITGNDISIVKNLNESYKSKVIKNGKCIQLTIPDMQSEENRDLLFTLNIPKCNEITKDYVLCKLELEYINVIKNSKENNITLCTINRSNNNENIGKRNMKIDIQKNRIDGANAMEKADNLAETNNLKEARLILTNAMNDIKKSVSKNDPFCKNLVIDLQKCYDKMQNKNDYVMYGQNMLNMNKAAHFKQRAVSSNVWGAQQCYANNAQTSFMNNWSSYNNSK